MDQLKKLSEISKFAVPFLVLCSSIQLMTYYHYWNIDPYLRDYQEHN